MVRKKAEKYIQALVPLVLVNILLFDYKTIVVPNKAISIIAANDDRFGG